MDIFLFFVHLSNLIECLYMHVLNFKLKYSSFICVISGFYYTKGSFKLLVQELNHIRKTFNYLDFYYKFLTVATTIMFLMSKITISFGHQVPATRTQVPESTHKGISIFQHPCSDLHLWSNLIFTRKKLVFSVIIVRAGIVLQVKGLYFTPKPLDLH